MKFLLCLLSAFCIEQSSAHAKEAVTLDKMDSQVLVAMLDGAGIPLKKSKNKKGETKVSLEIGPTSCQVNHVSNAFPFYSVSCREGFSEQQEILLFKAIQPYAGKQVRFTATRFEVESITCKERFHKEDSYTYYECVVKPTESSYDDAE